MSDVRIGIIGVGNMGTAHGRNLQAGAVSGMVLGAIADPDPESHKAFPDVPAFTSGQELIASGKVDAVLIATPHYDHVPLGIAAMEAGLHVLVEKPIAVYTADAELLVNAHRKHPGLVFAAMFNQRTDPRYRKVRELIRAGELGAIRRVTWIITDWFRTEAYYASGGWRATWSGEGGGVLLNQCPHQLDLWWWLFGAPQRVRAFCHLGKYHDIEVEDDVTAYLEYDSGMTGHFITSTGEHPGSNRLEISAERGRIVVEGDRVSWIRNTVETTQWSRTATGGFIGPDTWNIEIPIHGRGGKHVEIMQNFADAIRTGKPLLAPAEEGVHSVELANAMLYSSFLNETVALPLDGPAYAAHLRELIAGSRRKTNVRKTTDDFNQSFR